MSRPTDSLRHTPNVRVLGARHGKENEMIVPLIAIGLSAVCVAFAAHNPANWQFWPLAVYIFGLGILYAIHTKK